MQSDPQDDQRSIPGAGDGVPQESQAGPGSDPASDLPLPDMPPELPASGAPAPPQMPPPPRMPDATDQAPPMPGFQPLSDMPASPPDVPMPQPRAGTSSQPSAATDAAPQPEDTTLGDAVTPSAEAASQGDWMDRICPYLLSEDGTYRSTQPDDGHRCTAQDPVGTLPLAFQERFCLTDSHPRCEMYKYAEETRAAALGGGAGPAELVKTARFKPSVRSVPVALGGSGGGDQGDDGSRRPLIFTAIGVAGLAVIVFVIVLLVGDGGDGPAAPTGSASPAPVASAAPVATVVATPEPTPDPSVTPDPDVTSDPDATPPPSEPPPFERQDVQYEVQEGEALKKIAETFQTTRRRILNANPGMADQTPYVTTGDIIIVPASAVMTIEELQAVPGYIAPAPE